MRGRRRLRALRVALWVVIVIEVPLYLVWLVRVGYLTGQRLDDGDVAQWVPPVLLPSAAVVFCVAAGWAWWASMVAQERSPLRELRIVATLVFTAGASVFCGVVSVDDPSVLIVLLSVVVTGLGRLGGFVHENGFWLAFRDAATLSDGGRSDRPPGSCLRMLGVDLGTAESPAPWKRRRLGRRTCCSRPSRT